jgi:long-chain acyl-CoA synthetase
LSADGEILVRGPHVFAGYWNRPQDTAELLRDGWLHTGDQGEVDARGNWRITGRLKNMIILNSGHNIIPDALEEQLMQALPAARQVMLVGNQRGYLAAIVTGHVSSDQVEAGLRRVNPTLPHYKRIHRYCVHPEPFTQESGLLTANGKLRRDLITRRLAAQIETLYETSSA